MSSMRTVGWLNSWGSPSCPSQQGSGPCGGSCLGRRSARCARCGTDRRPCNTRLKQLNHWLPASHGLSGESALDLNAAAYPPPTVIPGLPAAVAAAVAVTATTISVTAAVARAATATAIAAAAATAATGAVPGDVARLVALQPAM